MAQNIGDQQCRGGCLRNETHINRW
jgi:hypothetical protein